MKISRLICLPLVLLASQAIAQNPTSTELRRALTAFQPKDASNAVIRHIRCKVLGDPTEFSCSYEEQLNPRIWLTYRVILAIDADHWIVIDDPVPEKK